jgi:hypothetical protein
MASYLASVKNRGSWISNEQFVVPRINVSATLTRVSDECQHYCQATRRGIVGWGIVGLSIRIAEEGEGMT